MGWPDETYPFRDRKPKSPISDIGEDDVDRNRSYAEICDVRLGGVQMVSAQPLFAPKNGSRFR